MTASPHFRHCLPFDNERPKEFWPIEVNHVPRTLRDPDFGFPGNISRISPEGSSIKESCNMKTGFLKI